MRGDTKIFMDRATRPTLMVKKKQNQSVYVKKGMQDKRALMMKEVAEMAPEVRGNSFLRRSTTKRKTRKILDDYEEDEETKLEVALQ